MISARSAQENPGRARTPNWRCRTVSWSTTIQISGSPSLQCLAVTSRPTTSRSWAAVTAVASSAAPSRTASSSAVQDVRPASSAATNEYGQPGMNWSAERPRPSVDVAEEPLRAGGGVRAQPVRDVHREHDPLVGRRRDRQRAERDPHPGEVDGPVVDRVVERAVPAPVLRHERELHQRLDRPVGAQHRIDEFEQPIRASSQRVVEFQPEPGQTVMRLDACERVLGTGQRGPFRDMPLSVEITSSRRAAPMSA